MRNRDPLPLGVASASAHCGAAPQSAVGIERRTLAVATATGLVARHRKAELDEGARLPLHAWTSVHAPMHDPSSLAAIALGAMAYERSPILVWARGPGERVVFR
jgi:hypothetical protein